MGKTNSWLLALNLVLRKSHFPVRPALKDYSKCIFSRGTLGTMGTQQPSRYETIHYNQRCGLLGVS